MNRIIIIFDRHDIYNGEGTIISGFQSELNSFDEIDTTLRKNEKLNKIYIVKGISCEHFKSYNNKIHGIQVDIISPASEVKKIINKEVPNWLTDNKICEWNLLNTSVPEIISDDDWEEIIINWLLPGLKNINNLNDWFNKISKIDKFPKKFNDDHIFDRVVQKFRNIATNDIPEYILDELTKDLIKINDPVIFTRKWMFKKAIAPFGSDPLSNPLFLNQIKDSISTWERPIINELPLVFPLPKKMHQKVSQMMQKKLHAIRLNNKYSIEEVVYKINAFWDGVTEELKRWLEINPKGLTKEAAEYLKKIPDFGLDNTAIYIYENYSPPDKIAEWEGLENFDNWVNSYSRYIRNCFFRRQLPGKINDPAAQFGRWIKDNFRVSYEHPDRGYCYVSKIIKKYLKNGRSVILLLIDALSCHIVYDFQQQLNKTIKEEPTSFSYLFSPLPTITKVSKQAIITGSLPNKCGSDLFISIKTAYNLTSEEVSLVANWTDAHRLPISEKSKLIVYRDNRLDDKLHSTVSYEDLLVESRDLFEKISFLVKRYIDDLQELNGISPVVLVTSDHGFTYGPKLTENEQVLPGKHRCYSVDTENPKHKGNSSLTFLDKELFHLKHNYYCATSRYLNSDTVSNWELSHGGLLPEEVIIPVIEWFGSDSALFFPQIKYIDEAILEKNRWFIIIKIKNSSTLPVSNLEIFIFLPGGPSSKISINTMTPGEEKIENVFVSDNNTDRKESINFEVVMILHPPNSGDIKKNTSLKVPIKKQLVVTTKGQEEFEEMFIKE